MMNFCFRTVSSFLLFLFCCLLIPVRSAGVESSEKSGKGLPDALIIRSGALSKEAGRIVPVKIDRSNVATFPLEETSSAGKPAAKKGKKGNSLSKSQKNRLSRWTKVPAGTLAGKLNAVLDKDIRWDALWIPGELPGIRIPDAALSPDESVIAFLETVGLRKGPYGTRIVLYDTHSWKVLQIFETDAVFAEKCVWLEGQKLVLLCRGQASRRSKHSLALYDPEENRITVTVPVKYEPGNSFISDKREFLAFTQKDASFVRLFRLTDEGIEEAGKYECESREPALVFDPQGKYFYIIEQNRLRTVRMTDFRVVKSRDLKLEFVPSAGLIPAPESFLILPKADAGVPAVFLSRQQAPIPVGTVSSGLAVGGMEKNTFYAFFSRQGAFGEYVIPSLDRIRTVSVLNSKPQTKGMPRYAFLIRHAKALAVLDSHGIFYLLYPDYAGKRWEKIILTKKRE